MEDVRVRLVFDDRHILNKSQKTEGLKRSWLLLKPQHKTIADLTSYLTHIFDLHHACPNGLLLSMDGFVLPPFESTCILKDRDVICVKKKKGTSSDVIEVGDLTNSFEIEEIVEKQPVFTGVKLLANEEFDNETGGYQSESEDDEEYQSEDTLPVDIAVSGNAISKKRKASKKLQSSKRKKNKNTTPETPEDVENDVHAEQIESFHDSGALPQKSLLKKNKSSHRTGKPDKASTPKIDGRKNNIGESMPSAKTPKRFHELRENGEGDKDEDVSHMHEGAKKFPSRSARRKKAKRQWLRELAKVEKRELHQTQSPKKDNQQSPQNDHIISTKGQQPDQNGDVEDEVVPIVIRPGHIRFEPLGKDEVVQQNQVPVETFQWNGITSKKKGQKWGKEKVANCKWNDFKDFNQVPSGILTFEEKMSANDPIDFDKLPHFTTLPKEGDVVAYCLIELSSSWSPEISSFRVGKISKYYPESNRVRLVPVPEHPIVIEKNIDEEASALQPVISLYREDGSLEVDFSSLVNVRLVKHGNSVAANAATGKVNGTPVRAQASAVSDFRPDNNNKEKHVPTPGICHENVEVNVWDEIAQTLSSKKAQLSRENNWNKKESPDSSSWSFNKALRRNALGPTMARLRAQKHV